MNSFKRILAFILGAVFTVSGVVKLVDPVGTGLIVTEYFSWLHLDFMRPAAKVTGELLSLAETLTGAALLAGVWRKFTAILTSAMLVFFTLVSIALVISDPVMDCGCFGEFIHLTHTQTLLKNIVLCIVAFFAFTPLWSLGITRRRQYAEFFIACSLVCAVAVYSWRNIPWTDFTDYKPFAPFTLAIWDEYGEEHTDDMLYGNVAVISIYHPEDLADEQKARIARFVSAAWNQGFTPYVLTTGSVDIPGVECYYGDYKSIITLNRSNGGVTLLDDGIICCKQSVRNLYDESELENISSQGLSHYCVDESLRHSIVTEALAVFYLILFLI